MEMFAPWRHGGWQVCTIDWMHIGWRIRWDWALRYGRAPLL